MAKIGEAREIEKSAIAFDRMNKTKNGIDARSISRIGFPCDDLAFARFQHFAGFSDEISQQIVHA